MKRRDNSARDKIVAARTNLLVSNGFFGCLALQLKLVECDEVNGIPVATMAVDGFNLYYHPAFVHKLTERELEGVVAHELMHCCFQHFTRRGHRHPVAWNVAGDHVINLELLEAGFTLPEKRLADPQFRNMTTEEVYDRLPIIEITMKGGGGVGDGEGKQGIDPGMCGGVLDTPGGAGKEAEAKQTWETNVRMAAEVARGQNAGNVPSSLRKLIDQLSKPKVSWKDLLRRFIDQSLTKEVSYARLNRRSVAIGALLPGYVSDRLHHLVCFVDVSGSISYELAKAMVSEAAGALDQGTADMLTICYTDTDVVHVDTYVAGDVVKAGQYSGGGTAFSNAYAWLRGEATPAGHEPNDVEPSAVIFLTDLQVDDFGQEPECPVMWAVYSQEGLYDQLAQNAPFGTCIHVGNAYD